MKYRRRSDAYFFSPLILFCSCVFWCVYSALRWSPCAWFDMHIYLKYFKMSTTFDFIGNGNTTTSIPHKTENSKLTQTLIYFCLDHKTSNNLALYKKSIREQRYRPNKIRNNTHRKNGTSARIHTGTHKQQYSQMLQPSWILQSITYYEVRRLILPYNMLYWLRLCATCV